MTEKVQGDTPTAPMRPDRKTAPRRTSPILALLRWLLGAFSLVAGFTWALVNLSTRTVLIDCLVGAVLVGGGLVLLMPHRVRLPKLPTALAMTGTALAGTLAGLFSTRTQTCCTYLEYTDRGWPFHWAQRGAVAGDADTAHRLALSSNWHVDLVSLAGNLLFFAYAGLLVVVLVVQIRRARGSKPQIKNDN